MLTLQVPESRPPVLPLTEARLIDPPHQPDLFEDAMPTGVASPPGAGPATLAAAGRTCTVALVDVLTGRRTAQQLARWTTDRVLADLVVLSRTAVRHPVRAVHPYVQVSGPGAAEIVIPFRPARGPWAPLRVVTARVEPYADRWRCSHLGWISSPQR